MGAAKVHGQSTGNTYDREWGGMGSGRAEGVGPRFGASWGRLFNYVAEGGRILLNARQ